MAMAGEGYPWYDHFKHATVWLDAVNIEQYKGLRMQHWSSQQPCALLILFDGFKENECTIIDGVDGDNKYFNESNEVI